jgi:hypothetical protein
MPPASSAASTGDEEIVKFLITAIDGSMTTTSASRATKLSEVLDVFLCDHFESCSLAPGQKLGLQLNGKRISPLDLDATLRTLNINASRLQRLTIVAESSTSASKTAHYIAPAVQITPEVLKGQTAPAAASVDESSSSEEYESSSSETKDAAFSCEVYGVEVTSTKVVIDTGATDSVGSPEALSALCNRAREQNPNVSIGVCRNSAQTTRFRLADGRITSAYSVVKITTALGVFQCYCMEAQGVPILLSIRSLRQLGATINFATNEMSYDITRDGVQVRMCKELEVSPKDHLLFDVLED